MDNTVGETGKISDGREVEMVVAVVMISTGVEMTTEEAAAIDGTEAVVEGLEGEEEEEEAVVVVETGISEVAVISAATIGIDLDS